MIMCPGRATCLSADCCFSAMALCKSHSACLLQRVQNDHLIKCDNIITRKRVECQYACYACILYLSVIDQNLFTKFQTRKYQRLFLINIKLSNSPVSTLPPGYLLQDLFSTVIKNCHNENQKQEKYCRECCAHPQEYHEIMPCLNIVIN